MLVRTQKVVIRNPESKVVVGALDVVKAVCFPIRSFIGAVQPFHDLFKRPVFLRHSIVVGKSDDLSDREGEILAKLL